MPYISFSSCFDRCPAIWIFFTTYRFLGHDMGRVDIRPMVAGTLQRLGGDKRFICQTAAQVRRRFGGCDVVTLWLVGKAVVIALTNVTCCLMWRFIAVSIFEKDIESCGQYLQCTSTVLLLWYSIDSITVCISIVSSKWGKSSIKRTNQPTSQLLMNKWVNEWMDEWTNEGIMKPIDQRTNKYNMNEWMKEWTN